MALSIYIPFERGCVVCNRVKSQAKLGRSTLRKIQNMPSKTFTSGRIKKADYDTATRQLDLHWDNKSVLAYKHVPEEVYRRLCSAPSPATYWEDRIAQEYPKGTPKNPGADAEGTKKLSDLFGPDE